MRIAGAPFEVFLALKSVAVGALVSKIIGNGALAPAHAAPLSVHIHYRGHRCAPVGNLTYWDSHSKW
jgi:hypothetical protein